MEMTPPARLHHWKTCLHKQGQVCVPCSFLPRACMTLRAPCVNIPIACLPFINAPACCCCLPLSLHPHNDGGTAPGGRCRHSSGCVIAGRMGACCLGRLRQLRLPCLPALPLVDSNEHYKMWQHGNAASVTWVDGSPAAWTYWRKLYHTWQTGDIRSLKIVDFTSSNNSKSTLKTTESGLHHWPGKLRMRCSRGRGAIRMRTGGASCSADSGSSPPGLPASWQSTSRRRFGLLCCTRPVN